MGFRATEYAPDPMLVDPNYPTTDPKFLGSAFQQQTATGVQFNDPLDDRVTFLADIDDQTEPYQRSIRLQAAQDSYADGPVDQNYSTVLPKGNIPVPPGSQVVVQSQGEWYDTLRPNAGYPLNQEDDLVYAAITGDVAPDKQRNFNKLTSDTERLVPEKPQQWTERLSREPASEQEPYRLWGTALGAWEWTGEKAAQDRPVADPGNWFALPLQDGIPSATGAAGAMSADYDLSARPLTFRAPPTPWDVGENGDNGYYVDGGQ